MRHVLTFFWYIQMVGARGHGSLLGNSTETFASLSQSSRARSLESCSTRLTKSSARHPYWNTNKSAQKSHIAINERASLCCLWITQFTVVYKVPHAPGADEEKEKLQPLVYATVNFHLMPLPIVAKNSPTFFVAFLDFLQIEKHKGSLIISHLTLSCRLIPPAPAQDLSCR